jgi:hypothetical protein
MAARYSRYDVPPAFGIVPQQDKRRLYEYAPE